MPLKPYLCQDVLGNISGLEVLFVDPQIENGLQTTHFFQAQDGIVVEAQINLKQHPSNHIKSILEKFGQPSEVWMWAIPESYQGILPTRYYLYYPEQGLFFHYATKGVKVNHEVHVCFDSPWDASVLLWNPEIWDPEGNKDFTNRLEQSSEISVYTSYRPIERVSHWNVEQFYNALTDPNSTECLETPSSLWPTPW